MKHIAKARRASGRAEGAGGPQTWRPARRAVGPTTIIIIIIINPYLYYYYYY